MDVIFFVVKLLDSYLWIVSAYFVGFVLEIGSKTLVDDFSSVFSTEDNMIVTAVYGVGIVYVSHTPILSRGTEEATSGSIPRAYARGFLSAVKIFITKFSQLNFAACTSALAMSSPRRSL